VTPTRRHSRRILPVTVAGVLAVAISAAVVPGVAGADPVADARAQAAALARQVSTLQTKAEVATEHYDAVEAQLGAAINDRMTAERALDAANSQTTVDEAVLADRARALYESGGTTSLLATVLDGNDLSDAIARYQDVGMLLGFDSGRVKSAVDRAKQAAALETKLASSAAQVTKLQVAAASAAGAVRLLLAQQSSALAKANRHVRQLVAAAEAAAQAASAQNFQQALLAAGGEFNGSTTPPSDIAAAAIAAAKTKLGDPYLWGGTGPDAYDCSGLTQFAYGEAGIALPRVAADQYNVGEHVSLAALAPGDLLFWATDISQPQSIHHVAMYLGAGMMIAAPHTGDVVKVEPVYMDGFIGATRPWTSN
jgi:cell wall-associated NlpC family hydrolase